MLEHASTNQEAETIVIKIGTAALSAKDGGPDAKLLVTLVKEIAGLKHAGHRVIVVTSGAVGVGRKIAREREIKLEGFEETQQKQTAASWGQIRLMSLYENLFAPYGITAAQVLTEKAHFTVNGDANKGIVASFKRAMKHLLGFAKPNPNIVNFFNNILQLPNVIPIVNENDTAAISELLCADGKGFSDNDELAGLIAKTVGATRVIFLSSGHGVCRSGDDLSKQNVIPFIDFDDPGTLPYSTDGKSDCGSGGMDSKLGIAKQLADKGILVYIASSREPGVIGKIMHGESVGTMLIYRLQKHIRPKWRVSSPSHTDELHR